jgi:hypothetical protein
MEIFITQNNQQTGPFSPQEIQAGLASGKYQSSDLIWYHGIEGWIPLSQASAIFSPSPSMYPSQPATCGLATASMILGVSGFFFLITSIPAVICGHIARGKIKKSQGTLGGGGLAMAGIITGYLVIGLIVVIAGLAALMAPMIMSQIKNAHRVEALNNAKQIGLALYVFEDEFGTYPNAETAKLVAEKTSTPEISGDSSNARFRQLIASGITLSEQMFHAKSDGTHEPDGFIDADFALQSGECGFGYIDNIPSNISDPRPIVMAPFISGTTKFDPEPYDGKAIILWTDNSARTYPIDSTTGEVIVDGKSILDPSHPVWARTPPNLLLPE